MNRRTALKKTGLLAGGSLMAPSLFSLLQSCQSQGRADWQPLFFSSDEAQFVSSLVDTILPATATPGALEVKVDVFMDLVFAKTMDADQQQALRDKMAQFNKDCVKNHGAVFADLKAEGQIAVLKEAEAQSPTYNGSVWGTAVGKQADVGLYRSLKSMAIWAYFSSEKIGKEVLNYDPIPQAFLGCIPLAEVGNRWTF